MNIRKLVKSGHSSLVIAVPREWIKRNRLKAGDKLYVEEYNNSLQLSPEVKKKPSEKRDIVIQVDGKDMSVINREITAAYVNGYFHIIIKGKQLTRQLKEIKGVITGLIALEIVEEDANRIIAQDFLNIHDIDLKQLVRRMDNIVRSMIIDTIDSTENPEVIPSIVERDREVNKLYYAIFKILRSVYQHKELLNVLKISEVSITRYWDLNVHLEKIADRAKNIASRIPRLSPKEKNEFKKLFKDIEKLYKEVMKAFYSLSMEQAINTSTKRDALMLQLHKYIKKSNNSTTSQIATNAYNMVAHFNDILKIINFLPD